MSFVSSSADYFEKFKWVLEAKVPAFSHWRMRRIEKQWKELATQLTVLNLADFTPQQWDALRRSRTNTADEALHQAVPIHIATAKPDVVAALKPHVAAEDTILESYEAKTLFAQSMITESRAFIKEFLEKFEQDMTKIHRVLYGNTLLYASSSFEVNFEYGRFSEIRARQIHFDGGLTNKSPTYSLRYLGRLISHPTWFIANRTLATAIDETKEDIEMGSDEFFRNEPKSIAARARLREQEVLAQLPLNKIYLITMRTDRHDGLRHCSDETTDREPTFYLQYSRKIVPEIPATEPRGFGRLCNLRFLRTVRQP